MRGDANDLRNKALQSMHTCGNGRVEDRKPAIERQRGAVEAGE